MGKAEATVKTLEEAVRLVANIENEPGLVDRYQALSLEAQRNKTYIELLASYGVAADLGEMEESEILHGVFMAGMIVGMEMEKA
jgi:hypothetical protein